MKTSSTLILILKKIIFPDNLHSLSIMRKKIMCN